MTNIDYSLWNDDPSLSCTEIGKYIAICGNTGAGKTTLVKAIIEKAKEYSLNIKGINERLLHHPLLKLMFYRPDEYAYVVQLNFLLQRFSILYRLLSIGQSVVIERSHLDDLMFVENHVANKHIKNEQYEAYIHVYKTLSNSIPDPDVYVYLDVPPDISIERLKMSEESKQRPKEFPNDDVMSQYVHSWYKRYSDLYERIIADKEKGIRFENTICIYWSAETNVEFMSQEIISTLLNLKK